MGKSRETRRFLNGRQAMAKTLTICDRSTDGRSQSEFMLDFITDRITARELIRSRVYQEVQDQKLASGVFQGLAQPAEKNAASGRRQLDWKQQFELALKAFEWRQVLVLVGDRQLDGLDAEIEEPITSCLTQIGPLPSCL
jgi:hypothetical protein